jgi:hypothetical protein
MGLASHTNAVGSHSRYKFVQDRQWGRYYGNHNVDEINNSYYVEDAYSWKPAPYHGDHRSAYYYTRSVFKVTADVPAIWHRYETIGNPPHQDILIDLYWETHMSQGRGTFGQYGEPDPNSDNARSKSITTALNNLQQHDAGFGADLGQTRKTIDEFAHMCSRFAAMLAALKHGNLKLAASNLAGMTGKRGTRSASKAISALWLEYIYGLKPLMKDLQELQAIVHDRLQAPLLKYGKGTGSSVVDHSGIYDDGSMDWHNYKKSSYKTQLFGQVSNPNLYALNQAGLINPLAIAWELLPWSFVIDWFVPVGQTLQACTAGCGLDFVGGWTTDQIHVTNEIKRRLNFTGYGTGCVSPGLFQVTGFEFRRFPHNHLPWPEFFADLTPYSTTRAVNALALVSQLT